MKWAWDQLDLPTGPLFVLVVLGDHAGGQEDEDWTCYPSVERIMRKTRMSRSAVERHLRGLETEGLLTRSRSRKTGGQLGGYRYVLHREPEVREALKAQRAQGVEGVGDAFAQVAGQTAGDSETQGAPCVRLQHGGRGSPGVDLTATMRQSDGPPCGRVTHPIDEPSIEEPSREPPLSAREASPIDEAFEAVLAAWAAATPDGVSRPTGWAAWRVALVAVEAGDLRAAALAYLAHSPAVKRGRGLSLNRWLTEQRWEAWMGQGASVAALETARWAGPPEVRTAFAAWCGEAWAARYIDPAGWDETGQRVLARTGTAEAAIRSDGASKLRDLKISVGRIG